MSSNSSLHLLAGLGSAIITKGCINDFLRDKTAVDLDQKWEYSEQWKSLKNGNGWCMGYYSAEIALFLEPTSKNGLTYVPCGGKNPLANGDPAQCDGTNPALKCCNVKEKGDYHWDGSGFTDIASTCGGTDEFCRCPTCLDYSRDVNIPEVSLQQRDVKERARSKYF